MYEAICIFRHSLVQRGRALVQEYMCLFIPLAHIILRALEWTGLCVRPWEYTDKYDRGPS